VFIGFALLMKKNIAFILLLTALLFTVISCRQIGDGYVEAYLKDAAKELNKRYPKMISEEMRLDSVSVSGTRTLVYNYTVVDYAKTEINADYGKEIRPLMIEKMSTISTIEELKEKDVTLRFLFHDKDGKYAFSFSVKARDITPRTKHIRT
jgi:hypothetical protein